MDNTVSRMSRPRGDAYKPKPHLARGEEDALEQGCQILSTKGCSGCSFIPSKQEHIWSTDWDQVRSGVFFFFVVENLLWRNGAPPSTFRCQHLSSRTNHPTWDPDLTKDLVAKCNWILSALLQISLLILVEMFLWALLTKSNNDDQFSNAEVPSHQAADRSESFGTGLHRNTG